jgi:D-aminopeptidase
MPLDRHTLAQLRTFLQHAVAGDEPGIAVAIAQAGETAWSGARGLANLVSRAPLTPQTPFRICSISKQFACTLAMREALQGHIDLNAHPGHYVPWTKALDPRVTVAHLMQNKSGLRDQWVMAMLMGARAEQRFTLEDGVEVMRRASQSMFAPGSQNSYCNGNFEILGEILYAVTGQTFSQLSHKYLFSPLGMHSSSVGIDTAAPIPGDARGYRFHLGAWREEENAVHWGASAGVVSTAEDLLKWAGALRLAAKGQPKTGTAVHPVVSHAVHDARAAYDVAPVAGNVDSLTLAAMHAITQATPFNDGYSAIYASGITNLTEGKRALLTHSGALRGWRSILMHFTREDTSIVVLMNRTNSPQGKLTRGVAMQVAEALGIAPVGRPRFAEAPQPSRANPTQRHPAAAGVYVSREQGLLVELGSSNETKRGPRGAKKAATGVPWLYSHLDRMSLLPLASRPGAPHGALFATEDGHLSVRVMENAADAGDGPAPIWLDMREENIHVPLELAVQQKALKGPFAVGGRYRCAPIESELDIQFNDGEFSLGFVGIFGMGVRYALSVVNERVAWFDLMRGVDESPPGRVLVYWDSTENVLELSCALARRIVFRAIVN